MEVAMCTQ
ncbi:unnamed protein product, partial [Rotaria sp. Silwood1]